jgi:hypothetical protein
MTMYEYVCILILYKYRSEVTQYIHSDLADMYIYMNFVRQGLADSQILLYEASILLVHLHMQLNIWKFASLQGVRNTGYKNVRVQL